MKAVPEVMNHGITDSVRKPKFEEQGCVDRLVVIAAVKCFLVSN